MLTEIIAVELAEIDQQTIVVPMTYSFLALAPNRDNKLCLWFVVDPKSPRFEIGIMRVCGANALPHVGSYIGTVTRDAKTSHYFTAPDRDIHRQWDFHYQTSKNDGAK